MVASQQIGGSVPLGTLVGGNRMAECGHLCLGFGRGWVAGIDCHCTFPQFVARNPRGPDAILQGEPVVAGRICAHVEAYAVTLLERSTAIRIDLGSAGDGFRKRKLNEVVFGTRNLVELHALA